MAFPTLSKRPMSEKKMPIDNAIRHETEDNHVVRRPRGTRVRHQYELTYDLMNQADSSSLIAHFESVRTYLEFTFQERNGTIRNVMYEAPLQYTETVDGWYRFESFTLTEV